MHILSAMGVSGKHFAKFKHLQRMVHPSVAHKSHAKHHGHHKIHHMHGKGGLHKKLEEEELPMGEGIRRHRKHAPLKFRM